MRKGQVRPQKLRVCRDCGDEKMVAPYTGGGVPERCLACSRKHWNARTYSKRAKKKAA